MRIGLTIAEKVTEHAIIGTTIELLNKPVEKVIEGAIDITGNISESIARASQAASDKRAEEIHDIMHDIHTNTHMDQATLDRLPIAVCEHTLASGTAGLFSGIAHITGYERDFSSVNIPLPSKQLVINASDSEAVICSKIDHYFEDIIRDYPDSTKSFIREMYYNDKNIVEEDLISKGGQANWHLNHYETHDDFRMTIDPNISHAPILFRLDKLHEIGVHIGQAHQRMEQQGFDQLKKEDKAFNRFTEQSVAIAEKFVFDALPMEVIERDCSYISDPTIRELIENDCWVRKTMSFDNYVSLKHRSNHHDLISTDHSAFRNHPQIKEYIKQRENIDCDLPTRAPFHPIDLVTGKVTSAVLSHDIQKNPTLHGAMGYQTQAFLNSMTPGDQDDQLTEKTTHSNKKKLQITDRKLAGNAKEADVHTRKANQMQSNKGAPISEELVLALHRQHQALEDYQKEQDNIKAQTAHQAARDVMQLGRELQIPFVEKVGEIGEGFVSLSQHSNAIIKDFGGTPSTTLNAITAGMAAVAPYAGLVLAATQVVMAFVRRNKNDSSFIQFLMGIFERFSAQLHLIRQEMHQRFDEMKAEFRLLGVDLNDTREIIRQDMSQHRVSINQAVQYTYQRLGDDISSNAVAFLAAIKHLNLVNFEHLIHIISEHRDGIRKERPIELIDTYRSIEKEWLLTILCDEKANGAAIPTTIHPRDLFKEEDMNGSISGLLGYLARFLRDELHIHDSALNTINLPNVYLWSHGLSASLTARQVAYEKYQTLLLTHAEHFNEIEKIPKDALIFIDVISGSQRESVFKALAMQYQEAAISLSQKMTKYGEDILNEYPERSLADYFINKKVENKINKDKDIADALMAHLSDETPIKELMLPKEIRFALDHQIGSLAVELISYERTYNDQLVITSGVAYNPYPKIAATLEIQYQYQGEKHTLCRIDYVFSHPAWARHGVYSVGQMDDVSWGGRASAWNIWLYCKNLFNQNTDKNIISWRNSGASTIAIQVIEKEALKQFIHYTVRADMHPKLHELCIERLNAAPEVIDSTIHVMQKMSLMATVYGTLIGLPSETILILKRWMVSEPDKIYQSLYRLVENSFITFITTNIEKPLESELRKKIQFSLNDIHTFFVMAATLAAQEEEKLMMEIEDFNRITYERAVYLMQLQRWNEEVLAWQTSESVIKQIKHLHQIGYPALPEEKLHELIHQHTALFSTLVDLGVSLQTIRESLHFEEEGYYPEPITLFHDIQDNDMDETPTEIPSIIEKILHLKSHIQNAPASQLPCVFVIGQTGCGKSTLINFLNGTDYTVDFDDEDGTFQLEPLGKTEIALAGASANSITQFPTAYPIEQHDYIDMPGFDGTEGYEEHVCTGVAMQFVAEKCDKVQTILITCTEEDFFSPRKLGLRSSLIKAANLLSKESSINPNFLLVITKSNREFHVPHQYEKSAFLHLTSQKPGSLRDSLAQSLKGSNEYLMKLLLDQLKLHQIVVTNVKNSHLRKHLLDRINGFSAKPTSSFNFSNFHQEAETFKDFLKQMKDQHTALKESTDNAFHALCAEWQRLLSDFSIKEPLNHNPIANTVISSVTDILNKKRIELESISEWLVTQLPRTQYGMIGNSDTVTQQIRKYLNEMRKNADLISKLETILALFPELSSSQIKMDLNSQHAQRPWLWNEKSTLRAETEECNIHSSDNLCDEYDIIPDNSENFFDADSAKFNRIT